MWVIIAEKPSVAKNIADALHISKKEQGYFRGEKYLVTWAYGHLLELYDAKDYDQTMRSWKLEKFPFIPNQFKYKIKQDKQKKQVDSGAKMQLNIIHMLIKNKAVEGIISACDYDREGQIIGDIILAYLKIKKPIYRLLLNEWTEQEVLKGLENIVPNKQLKPLQNAGISRQQADWLIGINLTSVATLKYGKDREVLNIGRVLLPTLKMIYDRDKEIACFKPTLYYKLVAQFSIGEWQYEGTYTKKKTDKFMDKMLLESIATEIENKPSRILKKQIIEKTQYPESLFNLSALQGYITSHHKGFTADKVLSVAQSLYEKKYITYPRTASSVLDESLVDKVRNVLQVVKRGLPFENQIKFSKSKRIFNSKKVESHSAIIPTYMVPKRLTPQEEVVYLAIRNRFLAQFMPVAKMQETVIETVVIDTKHIFITKGKIITQKGFRIIENTTSKDVLLPNLEEGMEGIVTQINVTEHKTKPPAFYTEKTLLRGMETCGKQFKNTKVEEGELMTAILSGFSIGTPATRADTIKKLRTAGYAVMKRKNITCTEKGRFLIETFPVKELMDLEYTGKLEKTLKEIEEGKVDKSSFMTHITDFVIGAVKTIKYPNKYNKKEGYTNKYQVVGRCPECGEIVVEGKKGFGCLGYKQGCKFVLWKKNEVLDRFNMQVTKVMAEEILNSKKCKIRLYSTNDDKEIECTGKYVKNEQNQNYEFILE